MFALRPLELRARLVAEGMLVGTHRSRRFGSSSEFAEHKIYAPGDDLRRIDWRAVARFDRTFVRRYEEETQIEIALIVDTSASMGYAGGARGTLSATKLEAAVTYAAALAWLAHTRSDAVSLELFAGTEKLSLNARGQREHLAFLLDQLARARADGGTALLDAVQRCADRQRRRTLVIVITDLIDVGVEPLRALGVLRKRGHDVIVLHTLHRDELEFPYEGVVRFLDFEGDREVQVDAPLVREAYLEEMRAFLAEVRDEATRVDVRYHLGVTDEPPALVLARALALGHVDGR